MLFDFRCFANELEMQYEEIIGDELKKRTINYIRLYTNEEYVAALISFLKKRGYGYIISSIEARLNNKEEDNIPEILKLLMEVDLIDKPRININNSFEKNSRLSYKKSKGLELKGEISVTSYNYPLKILHVTAVNKDIVKLSYDDNSIVVDVVIPSDVEKDYNVIEDIVIVTNYNALKIIFSIEVEPEMLDKEDNLLKTDAISNNAVVYKSRQESDEDNPLAKVVDRQQGKEKASSGVKGKESPKKGSKRRKRRKKKNTITSVKKEFAKLKKIFRKTKRKKL